MNKKQFDHDMAILTARLITSEKYLVLDTETTGLTEPEACQIGWVNESGECGVQLLKPTKPIEPGAESIHHISNDAVKDAPNMTDFAQKLFELSLGRRLVFYNAPFDVGVIANSIKGYAPAKHDVMLMFAAYVGIFDEYHNNYKWHKLGVAHHMCGFPEVEGLHDACVDSQATRDIMIWLAKQPTNGETEILTKIEAKIDSANSLTVVFSEQPSMFKEN